MATIADIRSQYPQYNDLSDEQLAQGFHAKFYSDMPYEEFASKIGLAPSRSWYNVRGANLTQGLGTQIAEDVKGQARGIVQSAVDVLPDSIDVAPVNVPTEDIERAGGVRQYYKDVYGITSNEQLRQVKAQSLAQTKAQQAESQARVAAVAPKDLTALESGIRGGVESLALAAPGLAAAPLTGGSSLVPLGLAGAQTGFDAYARARAEGKTPAEAARYSGVDALIEVATEKIPTDALLGAFGKKSMSEVKKELLRFVGGEVAGEQAATFLQSMNAYANGLDKELEQAKTFEEKAKIQAERQGVTALATIVSGGLLTGAALGAGKYQERAAAKQAEEDLRVADVARTYRAGQEGLGPRPEDIPLDTRTAPVTAPTAEPEGVAPVVPEGTMSVEDLLGMAAPKRVEEKADEEGPPPYTDDEIPAFVRGEGEVEPATDEEKRIKESAGNGATLQYPNYKAFLEETQKTGMSADDVADITGVRNEQDFLNLREQEIEQFVEAPAQDAVRRVYEMGGQPYSSNAYGPGKKGVEYIDQSGAKQFEPITPAAEKITTPETKLPEPAQLTLPITETPPAEALVQRSAFKAPETEAPSGTTEPSAGETVGGAGVRGTELPVSRPEPAGQGVAEPAGAGVGLPVYSATRADEGAEAGKPALTNDLIDSANQSGRGFTRLEISFDQHFYNYPKNRWGMPSGSAKDVPKSVKANARPALTRFLQSVTGSQKKTLPALVNDLHSILDAQQKEAVALLDRVDPNKEEPRPETGVELGKSIQDFSNIRKAIEETAMAWHYAAATANRIKTTREQTAQKTAPAPNTELFSITPQDTVNMWADPAFAPRAPGFKPRVKQIVGQARNGVISAEQAVAQIGNLAETPETRERAPIVRDVAHFKARLTQALRQGKINQATHDLTQWLISKNPKLIEGLGLSISTRDPSGRRIPLGVQGLYSVVQDIVTLVPRANSDVTLVHEILHRAERMMPPDIQAQIRKIWERQLFANLRTAEMRGTEFEKDFYNRLVEYHFGDRNSPEDLKALQDLIKTGAVPAESYQFMNPSEFWAVNASRIMQNRFKASPTFVARVKQWLKEFVGRIKGVMDLPSDAPFLRAMDKVMKGDGQFVSPTIYGDERLNSIERETRYKGWKSPEREYRDGEELINRRAEATRRIQKAPSPDQLIKESLTKKAYEDFVDKAQSILRPWKRERQRLENEGKLIEDGPKANDVYGILSQVTGIARWYDNMYVMPIERQLYDNISAYGKEKGISAENALEFFAQFRQAMSADLRRDEFYRRYKPLSTNNIYQLSNGKKIAPSALRLQLYRKAADLLGNQTIPQDKKRKMLDDIRTHLDALVSNKAYEDELGHSMHPNRPVDTSGNPMPMNTKWDAQFYSPAEGTDPILHTGPTLRVLEDDLKKYPSLRKAMEDFNRLQDTTKNLNRKAGVWNEYLDDVSYFYGWGDGYSPLMMEKEDSPLNLEGTRNSGDVSTFVAGMQGGNHRTTNAVFQSLANAHRAASIAARGQVTQRIANLIDAKEIPGKHMIDISPREQFMLALENQPIPTDVMGGNVIIYTLPDGTKSVYRMDNETERGKKLLDGVRRVNEEMPKTLQILGKAQGVIASMFTRLRAPFAPGQFVMDSMTLAPMISAEYGLRFGPQFLARATANLATFRGPKIPKLMNLYREGNEAAIREYVKDDPFLTDAANYLKEGGPSVYADMYKIEKGLTNYVRKIKQNPMTNIVEGFSDLVDNWTDSWDMLSRVSAMGVLKNRELEKLGYADAVKKSGKESPEAKRIMNTAIKRAAHQAKELSNFNLHGNMTSRKIAAFYMFWRPNVTTAVATADMIGKAFEKPEARITRELSPEAQADQKLVEEKLNEFNQQRIRTRTVIAIMMGAGMALYELARAMSDYDEEGRNKVAASDKGQWIRAAQFRIPGTDWNFNAMFGFGPGGFMALGAQMSALLHGDQTVGEFSKNSLNTIFSMFTPITPAQIDMTQDFTKWFIATFSPSLIKPIAEYAQNRTSIDTEIYNAHPSRFSEIYSGGKNVPEMYKALSKSWIDMTGEEVAPNKLYFFASHFAQAVSDVATLGYDIKSALIGDKNVSDINWKTLAGSFISRVGNTDSREYADLEPEILEAQHRLSMFETDPLIAEKLRAKHPDDARIVGIYNSTKYQLQQYQTMRGQLNRSNLPPQLKRERLEQVEAAMDRLKYATVSAIKNVELTKQSSKP